MVMLFNNSMSNVLKWQRGKGCFTKIVQVLSSKKPQCCLTLMLTAPDFFLKHFRVSLKNSPWLLKESKGFTHTCKCFAFEKTKQKSPWHLHTYPIPFFVFDYVQPQKQDMNVSSHEWVRWIWLYIPSKQNVLRLFSYFCLLVFKLFILFLPTPFCWPYPSLTSKFPKASI